MKKTKKAETTKILSIRFPEALIKKLDRYVKRFEKEFPGISFQRTDAIRLFVERGIKDPITTEPQPEELPKPQKPPKPLPAKKSKAKKDTKTRQPAQRKPGVWKTKARKKR